ncbi:GntR family transcriptional regulator [Seohaeicola zhoushanensis]
MIEVASAVLMALAPSIELPIMMLLLFDWQNCPTILLLSTVRGIFMFGGPTRTEQPVQKTTHGAKGESVVQALRTAIHGGRYVPGQRLVEADLTSELGVSRSLLREAFRILSAEGLIETVPNRGALVKRLSRREAMELFEIRMELEALSARLAAKMQLASRSGRVSKKKFAKSGTSPRAYPRPRISLKTNVFTELSSARRETVS